MPFNPRDFLALAEELLHEAGHGRLTEARLRTAISRAYYSALLAARETVRERLEAEASDAALHMFEDVARSHLVHRLLREILDEADTYLRMLFSRLQMLRRLSDYETSRRIERRECEEAIAGARELLSRIAMELGGLDATRINAIVSEHYTRLRSRAQAAP